MPNLGGTFVTPMVRCANGLLKRSNDHTSDNIALRMCKHSSSSDNDSLVVVQQEIYNATPLYL